MKPAVKKIGLLLLFMAGFLVVLAVSAFFVWRERLANDVDHQIAAIRAAGLPTNAKEADAYYTAVPDDQNAAVKMADAFALMENYDDIRSNDIAAIKLPSRKDPLQPEQVELLTDYCAMNSNALAQAEEAVKLPCSRYPIDLTWGAGTQLPHLAHLKHLAAIAEYQSALNPKTSARNISIIVGMAHTLDTEPLIISKLVRIAMLKIAEASLERRLNSGTMSEADLKHLQELFAETDQTNQMANGLIGERAMYSMYFGLSWAELEKLSNESGDDPLQAGPPLPGSQPFIFRLTGFWERDLRFYLQSMRTNISLAATLPVNMVTVSNVEEQISQSSLHKFYILSALLLPGLKNATIKNASGLAQIRSTQTALAVERFHLANGRLPQRLDELVPQFISAVPAGPFDGQPLRYRRLDKGYVVYSVGSDGEDNGGRETPANVKSTDKTHYDITFTVER